MLNNQVTSRTTIAAFAAITAITLGATLAGCGKTESPDATSSPAAEGAAASGTGATSAAPSGPGAAPQSAPPASYQGKSYGGQVAKPE